MVLVDTSIWSLALRRRPKHLSPEAGTLKEELAELIREGRVRLIGPIRQELLSGISEETHFKQLRVRLLPFEDTRLETRDYEEAARCSNICRAAGVAGSSVDFLICATAMERRWPVFTTDRDFEKYARHLPIQLHAPRSASVKRL